MSETRHTEYQELPAVLVTPPSVPAPVYAPVPKPGWSWDDELHTEKPKKEPLWLLLRDVFTDWVLRKFEVQILWKPIDAWDAGLGCVCWRMYWRFLIAVDDYHRPAGPELRPMMFVMGDVDKMMCEFFDGATK